MKSLIRKTAAALCLATCLATGSLAQTSIGEPKPCTDLQCSANTLCWKDVGCIVFLDGYKCECNASPSGTGCECQGKLIVVITP